MKRYAKGAVFGAILGASGFAIAGYPHYPQANNAGIMPGAGTLFHAWTGPPELFVRELPARRQPLS